MTAAPNANEAPAMTRYNLINVVTTRSLYLKPVTVRRIGSHFWRIVTASALGVALTRSLPVRPRGQKAAGTELPIFMDAKNVNRFIDSDLAAVLTPLDIRTNILVLREIRGQVSILSTVTLVGAGATRALL